MARTTLLISVSLSLAKDLAHTDDLLKERMSRIQNNLKMHALPQVGDFCGHRITYVLPGEILITNIEISHPILKSNTFKNTF